MKVSKKDIIIINVAVYLLLAFFFLYLQHAYRHHLSPFSVTYFRKSLELFWYVAAPVFVSILLIWRHHKWALAAYTVSISLVGFKVIEGLFIEFNKIIVIALFFYAVISYFLYQLLSYYLSMASINANYSSDDLFRPLLRTIPCQVEVDEVVHAGMLTNWDEEGCFIKLDVAHKLPGKVVVRIQFQGREFVQSGEVVAQSVEMTGLGVRFNQTPKDLKVFNWSEFMEIVQELGFLPERLR